MSSMSHFILFASVASHLCRIASHRIASQLCRIASHRIASYVAAQRSSPAYVVAENSTPGASHLILPTGAR
jgi:hypothetical protein